MIRSAQLVLSVGLEGITNLVAPDYKASTGFEAGSRAHQYQWPTGQHGVSNRPIQKWVCSVTEVSICSAPHIVVLGSCKVGNFVVSTPVLRGLRVRFPDAVIGFIGSEVTADFEQALGLLIGAAVGTTQARALVCACCRIWFTSVNAMALCNWLSILMALIRSRVFGALVRADFCGGWQP